MGKVELVDGCNGRNRGCNMIEIQSQGLQREDKENGLEVALRRRRTSNPHLGSLV